MRTQKMRNVTVLYATPLLCLARFKELGCSEWCKFHVWT